MCMCLCCTNIRKVNMSLQEFCLFAVVGLLSDFFLQILFFTTVLSIDIRRMEVGDFFLQTLIFTTVLNRHQAFGGR